MCHLGPVTMYYVCVSQHISCFSWLCQHWLDDSAVYCLSNLIYVRIKFRRSEDAQGVYLILEEYRDKRDFSPRLLKGKVTLSISQQKAN